MDLRNHAGSASERCDRAMLRTVAHFWFAIESSANINTTPRTEQTVITLNRRLYEFYNRWGTQL